MFGTKQKKKTQWVQSALERYERPLLQYSMSIVGEIERARDVVQETFMRLHKQEQEAIEGHLSQWLFTVCRNCSLKSLKKGDPTLSGKEYYLVCEIEQGISTENAKKVSKIIRDEGPKSVKAQIQGDELRVTSKSRDDLQSVQALVKGTDLDFAVQFVNYR